MGIEDVADAAGVSRSLVYSYFGDRDSLVAEVYLRVVEQVDEEAMPGSSEPVPSTREDLVRRLGALLHYAREHPSAWRLLVTDSVRRHPAVAAARTHRIRRLAWAVEGCPPLVAEATLGLVESGVMHWVDHQDISLDAAAELLATTVWSGLTKVEAQESAGVECRD